MKVVSYLKGIPAKNKNLEKPKILQNFIKGVNAIGDQGILHDGFYIPSDVAVVQGYVHKDSPASPHLQLRKTVIDQQKKNNKHTVLVDSNLFLYIDKTNPGHYLRYSLNGVFPSTGNYFSDTVDPRRWEKISNDLNLKIKPWKQTGNYILICMQRNGGWSMKGYDNQEWVLNMIYRIRKYSDRPIVLRGHPGDKNANIYLNPAHRSYKFKKCKNVTVSDFRNRTLTQDLENAFCTVVYNSSPAVASAIEGVPVYADDPNDCQAAEVANVDISKIESFETYDRLPWLRKLAMSHWNFDELINGDAWQHMRQFCK